MRTCRSLSLAVAMAVCCLMSPAFSIGATYHVDSIAGDDSRSGLSPAEAWRTLDRVNGQTFQPGDAVLFKSGCRWRGQLTPRGSGAEGKPIRIDRYGEGELPVIYMAGAKGAVLALVDQDWWEIRHLHLIGGGEGDGPGHRAGIRVEGVKARRVLRHIHITDCRIEDIQGDLQSRSSGIWVAAPSGGRDAKAADPALSLEDVLIANNEIRDVSRAGIIVMVRGTSATPAEGAKPGARTYTWSNRPPGRDIVVRGNRLEELVGDTIIVRGADGPLVERNVSRRACLGTGAVDLRPHKGYNQHSAAIWLAHCVRGVMQFNEVSHTYRQPDNNDGMSFDFDNRCFECVLQYNVSRENEGGFILIMPSARDNVVRYNLSENDRTHVLFLQGSPEANNLIHNNVFAVDIPVYFTPGGLFRNNIFYATGHGRFLFPGKPLPGQFQNNCYFGRWEYIAPWRLSLPADPGKIESDPRFVAPGAGGEGLDAWRGYQLRPDSPCRDAGAIIEDNGGRDFWGNPLKDGKLDIGAHELPPGNPGSTD